jgi:FkbM family methyltransferase
MLNRGARVVSVEPQPELAAELVNRFPSAIVLQVAVSDERGNAVLHMAKESDQIASLDDTWTDALPATWTDTLPQPVTWNDEVQVQVMTADELISEYGEPRLIKIDTEGCDHKVLSGLSQPVQHVLFETNPARAEAAAECFARLEELGRYQYFWAPHSSGTSTWLFRKAQPAAQILDTLVSVGDVYARRIG